MRSAVPPRRPSHLIRYLAPAVLLVGFFYFVAGGSRTVPARLINNGSINKATVNAGQGADSGIQPDPNSHTKGPGSKKPEFLDADEKPIFDPSRAGDSAQSRPHTYADTSTGKHPIDTLIKNAQTSFDDVLGREATTLAQAADAYRKRRGRHPPPGFAAWYEFARKHNAIVVEDFWDQIYHDLNPFWGVDPARIRKEAWDYEMTINIRKHNASAGSDWFWTQIWLNHIKTIEHLLPDMDLALNAMDEPRLVVPWEDINGFMNKEKKTRHVIPASKVESEFEELPIPEKMPKKPATRDKDWEGTSPYWAIARRGCPPTSMARRVPLQGTFDKTPVFEPSYAVPHQYQGYTANSTLASDFCHQPDLQGLEGIFIKPLTTAASKYLWPMFGGSKLATNNEILLPAPMYWNEEERFTGGDDHGAPWDKKQNKLIWRGVATGGKNTKTNWKGFQRHRFVSMANGTKVSLADRGSEKPVNFQLPHGPESEASGAYDLAARKAGNLGGWVDSWSDVGFTDLMCDDDAGEHEPAHCSYTDDQYDVVNGQPLPYQFGFKYLPDIDGNSFSGRYLGFLRSTSLPIKSTLFREWHDSRLFAWKHFVPMDNRFGDFYGIMEYFMGVKGHASNHDAAARKIAMDGKAWAEKVLRKEDMQIYTLRLLLEYARVSDPRRESMGWADDLVR